MLRITKYAQRLLDDLDGVDYIDRVKAQQRNWIGHSTGAQVRFASTLGDEILIYTTRPDTLFGATYMVLSPEHELLSKWMDQLENQDEIKAYQKEAASKSDFERTELVKDKTGVMLKGRQGHQPPSTAGRSRSLSPTMSSRPTARARSWPCRRMTTATGRSRRNSAARSSRSSRAAMSKRPPLPTAPPA